jgi:glutamine amidotransferase
VARPAKVAIAGTGAANLASVRALCLRAGTEGFVTEDPGALLRADFAVLPGVGSFGAAMARLAARGLDAALHERFALGRPTMGICLGMQMMCLSSEESPGAEGIGIVEARIGRFAPGQVLPQLGWNRVFPALATADDGGKAAVSRSRDEGHPPFVKAGWAYFANSYRLSSAPAGFSASMSDYGETFVASLEFYSDPEDRVPSLLACQFHPELSGPWGLDLFARWVSAPRKGVAG